jgi:hypothetical protein
MRQLSASAAVMTPAGGSNVAQAADLLNHLSQVSFSSPRASNGTDAILAIGIVLAVWAVALWGASCFSHIAN